MAGTLVLAIAYGAVDVRRLEAYQSAILIWQDAAQYQPDNPVVQTNWGVALAAAGRTTEAIEHYQAALAIDPQTRGATRIWPRRITTSGCACSIRESWPKQKRNSRRR